MTRKAFVPAALLIISALASSCAGAASPAGGAATTPPPPPATVSPKPTAVKPVPSPAPPALKLTPAPKPTVAPTPTNADPNAFTREEAEVLMEEIVRFDPTFQFDGIEDSLKLVEVKEDPGTGALTFTFEFQSRHAGYGDRSGKALAQVITTHRAVMVFEDGDIASALMDGKWDMLEETLLP